MNSLQNVTATCLRFSVRGTLKRFPKQVSFHQNAKEASTSTTTSEDSVREPTTKTKKIVIPRRVERGPTDILKALSSTVKKDYTAPHYKYHDDPFLTPTNNLTKRAYALSQESGRKAARWIRQEHADLFQHKVADPPVEAFYPQAVYNENSQVDESVLQKVIALHQVSDAITVFGLLENKGVEVSRQSKQSLLELVCYYNSQDNLEEEWIEERWFRQGSKIKEKKMNVWKRGGMAEKLFESMAPHDSASYAAMICGKVQFGDVDGAYRLYLEASDVGLGLPVEVFNKLIAGAPILKEGHEMRWQFVEDMLGEMRQRGVAFNLGTLNSILETISSMSTNKDSQELATSILAEFRSLDIEPSPASYCFLMRIFTRDRRQQGNSPPVNVLVSILNTLEGRTLCMQDPRDVLFFSEAMDVCRFHLRDLQLAYRLDRLLHTADNYNLIGDSYKESVYYRNLFALICETGTLAELMTLYNKLVPNIYVPEPGIMEEIMKVVEIQEAWDLLPKMWSDIVMFDQASREATLTMVLTTLRNAHTTDASLNNQLADVARNIWERVETQRAPDRLNKKISWTGEMLGDVLVVLLRADRYSQALEVVTCLDRRQQEILGVPQVHSLAAFLDKSIENKQVSNAIWCIQYCLEAGYEDTPRLAQKLNDSGILNDSDRSRLANIVGQEALRKESVVS